MPKVLPQNQDINKSFLILFESEVIRPDNWDKKNHQYFNKIFTWNDDYVDNNKYFKINFAHKIINERRWKPFKERKLCTLVAGNKKSAHHLELYSKRTDAISWFERHHPENFDLFGIGWDRYSFASPKILNRLKIPRLRTHRYKCYKGPIEEKFEIFSNYKFAICFENAHSISGYITEKIFDCFFSGTIPIYKGPPNIEDHIPSNCFIDIDRFKCFKELYEHITNMSEQEHYQYQKNIHNFLSSEKTTPFKAEAFATTITNTVLKSI